MKPSKRTANTASTWNDCGAMWSKYNLLSGWLCCFRNIYISATKQCVFNFDSVAKVVFQLVKPWIMFDWHRAPRLDLNHCLQPTATARTRTLISSPKVQKYEHLRAKPKLGKCSCFPNSFSSKMKLLNFTNLNRLILRVNLGERFPAKSKRTLQAPQNEEPRCAVSSVLRVVVEKTNSVLIYPLADCTDISVVTDAGLGNLVNDKIYQNFIAATKADFNAWYGTLGLLLRNDATFFASGSARCEQTSAKITKRTLRRCTKAAACSTQWMP